MNPQRQRLLANHERIREGLRRLLGHTADANHGDLVSALALSRDLDDLAKALEVEREAAAAIDPSLQARLDGAGACVSRAAASISFVFSVRAILECVAGIARLLEDLEVSLLAPPLP